MNRIRYIIVFLTLWASCHTDAQNIKRWTLSSTGRLGYYISANNDTIAIESTFGQCPGCTVINGGSNIIRQGFQQPLVDRPEEPIDTSNNPGGGGPGGTTGLPPCQPNDPAGNFSIDFNILEKVTTCGTYFDFDYTGDLKPNMKFGWKFGTDAVPANANIQSPSKIGYASKGFKFIRLEVGVTCYKAITKSLNVQNDAFLAKPTVNGTVLCKGQKTGSISLTASGGTPPYNYAWNNLPAGANQQGLSGGTYIFTVTDSKNCQFSAPVSIKEPKDSLKLLAKIKDETCRDTKDGEITLTPKGGTAPYEFLWSDNASSVNRTNLSVGKLNVTVTDDNGCKATLVADVKRYCDKTGTDFPNTFTPNDDGVNDGWEFPGIDDFTKNRVEIYNRWGSLVYQKDSYKSGEWKGLNSAGQPLPAGPYYYVVNLNDRDKTVFAGAVTIIR